MFRSRYLHRNKTDICIHTDNYDKLTSVGGITCNPELKEKDLYSLTKVDCSMMGISMSAFMSMLIGQVVQVEIKFGEEDGKAFMWDTQNLNVKLYKVSDDLGDYGGNSGDGSDTLILSIIIVVVVVVVIIVVVVVILVLASEKNQKTKKLPTKTVSDKPAQSIPAPVAPTQPAPAQPVTSA